MMNHVKYTPHQLDLFRSLEPHLDLFACLENKTVLLTGANGMLPGVMLDTLILLNEKMDMNINIQALVRRRDENKNIKLNSGRLTQIEVDLSLPQNWGSLIKTPPDYVIHAASIASPARYIAQPLETIYLNVFVTQGLMEYAGKYAAKGFLYFSSGEIYGSPSEENTPTKEDYMPSVQHLSGRSAYVESKRFGEVVCQHASDVLSINTSVIRPIHVFGPGLKLNDGRVISDFIEDALHQKKISVQSDGSATRAFCYLTDANIMMWYVLLGKQKNKQLENQQQKKFDVFNIGNPNNEISIAGLAEMVADIYGLKFEVLGEPSPHAMESPQRSSPCIEKVVNAFDFSPQVSLSKGIQQTYSWAKEFYDL